MDLTSLALFLAGQGATIIEKGLELWQATGKSPEAYDAAVNAAREARQAKVLAQRAAELAAMGGK
jgi:hypothetical protein